MNFGYYFFVIISIPRSKDCGEVPVTEQLVSNEEGSGPTPLVSVQTTWSGCGWWGEITANFQ